MSTEACDVLGHGSRYAWGLSQVSVNAEVPRLSRMENVAAIRSERRCSLLRVGLTISQISQPFGRVGSLLKVDLPLGSSRFVSRTPPKGNVHLRFPCAVVVLSVPSLQK